MLTVISAPPRTGKTLYCVQKIFEYLNQGRPVYTNILGINIPGVLSISGTIENPHDWRDLPNGSVVIYDEAHEHAAFSSETYVPKVNDEAYDKLIEKVEDDSAINATEKKNRIQFINRYRKKDAIRKATHVRDIAQALLMHGHFGFDIILITQKPNLLNSYVQAACSEHLWLRRIWGLKMATIFEFPEVRPSFSKSARQDALSVKSWPYPKHLYKFYKSSENHTDKLKIPPKYIVFACIPLVVIAYGIKGFSNSMFNPANQEKNKQELVEKNKGANQKTPTSASSDASKATKSTDQEILDRPLNPVAAQSIEEQSINYGCITIGHKKTCYDSRSFTNAI